MFYEVCKIHRHVLEKSRVVISKHSFQTLTLRKRSRDVNFISSSFTWLKFKPFSVWCKKTKIFCSLSKNYIRKNTKFWFLIVLVLFLNNEKTVRPEIVIIELRNCMKQNAALGKTVFEASGQELKFLKIFYFFHGRRITWWSPSFSPNRKFQNSDG